MKAIWKGLIAGIILIAIGAGIIITTLAVNGWKIKDINYTMKTFTAQSDVALIDVDVDAYTLKTEFYDGDKIEISYPESKALKTRISEKDGKLKFETDTKWYASLFNFTKPPETVVKLPKDKVYDIIIDLGAGTVKLADGVYGNINIDVSAGTLSATGVTCDKIVCDVSAGTLNIKELTCPDIKADVSAGTLNLGIAGAKEDYTIRASVSVGSCNVTNQTGATGKKLDVDCSAGKISVNFKG